MHNHLVALGHNAGDEVWIDMACILLAHARSGDFGARIGGDAFVIAITARQLVNDLEHMSRGLIGAVSQLMTIRTNPLRPLRLPRQVSRRSMPTWPSTRSSEASGPDPRHCPHDGGKETGYPGGLPRARVSYPVGLDQRICCHAA